MNLRGCFSAGSEGQVGGEERREGKGKEKKEKKGREENGSRREGE